MAKLNKKEELFAKNLKPIAAEAKKKKETKAKKMQAASQSKTKASTAKNTAAKSQKVTAADKRMEARESYEGVSGAKVPKKTASIKKNQSTGASKYKKQLPKVKDTTYTTKSYKPSKKKTKTNKIDVEIAKTQGKKTGPVQKRLDEKTQYYNDKIRAESTAGRIFDAANESFLNNTVGVPYQIVKGEKLFKPSKAMIDTGGTEKTSYKVGDVLGNVAAFALPYGAASKSMGKAADVVMKTKLAQRAVGKAGQKIGAEVAGKVAKEGIKDFIGDSTIGLVQNVALARGEGLEGEELVKDVAKNQAFDYALGGAIDATPAIKKAVSPRIAAWKEARAAAKAERQAAKGAAKDVAEDTIEQVAKPAKGVVEMATDETGEILGEAKTFSGGKREAVRKLPKKGDVPVPEAKPKKKHFEQVKEVKEAVRRTLGFDKYSNAKSVSDGFSTLVSKARKGVLSDDEIRSFAEAMLEEAKIVDSSMVDMYGDLKSAIKSTPLSISDEIRSNIPDWNDFRKAHFGNLNLKKDGLPVDSFYAEMQEMYPGVLPDVNTVPEMVEELADAAKRIKNQEYSIKTFCSDTEDLETLIDDTITALKKSLGGLSEGLPKSSYIKADSVSPGFEKTYNEFIESTSDDTRKFAEKVLNGGISKRAYREIREVTPKEALKIKQLTGIDARGYKHSLPYTAIEHINSRHGINGVADHSMASLDDISRIDYVLENYDNVELVTKANRTPDVTTAARNADGSPSRMVKYKKRVDGHYYVVEAVPDSEKKRMRVVSAYIEKADRKSAREAMHPEYAAKKPPQVTSETPNTMSADSMHTTSVAQRHTSTGDADTSVYLNVSQPEGGVKMPPKKADFDATKQQMRAKLRQTPATQKAGKVKSNGIPEVHEKVSGFDVESSNIGIVNPDLKAINDMMDKGNSVFDTFYKSAVSGQMELEKLSKAAGNTKVDDFTQAVRNGSGTVSYIFDKGLVDAAGNVVNNVSYKELINTIPKKLRKDFNTYAQHLHNIDRIREGKPVFKQYTALESQAIVNGMLAKHPEFKQYTENINKWWTDFIQTWLVDTGRVTQESFDAMRKMYPNYIPTYRVDKKNGGGGLANRIGVGSGIKKAVGGESEVKPLEDTFLAQMTQIVKSTKKNDLYLSIIEELEKNPENLKHFGVKTTDKGVLDNTSLDDLLNEVEKKGLKQVKDNTYMLTAYKDGVPVSAYINKDIKEALDLLDDAYGSEAMRRFANIGKKVSDPMKAGITGYNPLFALSNAIRDLPTLYIQSEHGMLKTTTGIGKALKQLLTNGEMLQKYAALGGKQSGYFAQGKGFEKALEGKTGLAKVKQNVENVLSIIGEGTETIPRLAEFINSVEKYGNTKEGVMKALKDAGEVTVNFSRSAPVTKTLDAWTLYLNAAVQGLDKFGRTVKAHPLRTVGRSATMITLPYVALMAINWENPHYHDLNDRTKQNYFLIPNVCGEKDSQGNAMTFIKLPVNREYGALLGSSLDVIGGYLRGEENPWKGYAETIKTNFAPPSPITDNILSPLMINLPNNKDFAGRTIVPQSLEKASSINQSDSTTSGAAKAVATLANKLPIAPGALKSPKKVDYLIDSYGGYYGQVLQGATSKDSVNVPTTAKNTVTDPFVQRFTADPRYSSGVVSDFYDKLDAAETEKVDASLAGKEYSEGKAKYKAYNKVANAMSELTKKEKQILNSNLPKDQKTKEIKKLRQKKNELARGADKKAEEAVKEYKQAPTFAALDKDVKARYKPKSGVSKESWGKAYKKQAELGNSAAKTLAIINSGVTDLEQAQSISSRVTETSMKKALALKDAKIKSTDFDKAAKKINKNKDSYYSVEEITSYLDSTDKYTRLQKRVIFSVLTNAKSNPY